MLMLMKSELIKIKVDTITLPQEIISIIMSMLPEVDDAYDHLCMKEKDQIRE